MSYLKTSKQSVLDMRYLHKYVFCLVRHNVLLISQKDKLKVSLQKAIYLITYEKRTQKYRVRLIFP